MNHLEMLIQSSLHYSVLEALNLNLTKPHQTKETTQ